MTNNKYTFINLCEDYYTFVVVISCTILGHIQSSSLGIMYLTLAVIIAIPLCIFSGIEKSPVLKISVNSFILIIYSIYYIYSIIRGSNNFESYLQLCALVICAFIGGKYCLDIQKAKKWIINIALIASVCLIIQSLMHGILSIHIPMLPTFILNDEQLASYGYSIIHGMSEGANIYRPSSFFLEPSHFVQFSCLAIALLLFDNEKEEKKNIKKAIFVTIAVIATVSSTGFALLLILWGIWVLFGDNKDKTPKWGKAIVISIMLIGSASFVFVSSNSVLGVYFQRILPSNLKNLADSQEGRFWANRYLNDFSASEWMFGKGIGTVPHGYFMGYARIIFQLGLVGFILFLLVIFIGMIKGNKISRIIGLLYVVLLFGAEFDVFRYIIFYLSFVFFNTNSNLKKEAKI